MASQFKELFESNKLQRWEDDNPRRKEVVDRIGVLMDSFTKTELGERFKLFTRRKQRLEKIEKKLNFELEALEAAMAQILEATGEEGFKLSTGGSYFLQPVPYVKVLNELELKEWAIQNGFQNELKLNSKKLQGIVNDRLKEGMNLPPGVKVTMKAKIGTRNVKDKE